MGNQMNPFVQDTKTQAIVAGIKPATAKMISLRTHVGRFIWFLVALIAIFSKALITLVAYAAGNNLHSYILLVPFVSAYLIYVRWKQLPKRYGSSPGWALLPLSAALVTIAVTLTQRTVLSRND